MAVTRALRPSICALPFQHAWVTRTAPEPALPCGTDGDGTAVSESVLRALDSETKTVGFVGEVYVEFRIATVTKVPSV